MRPAVDARFVAKVPANEVSEGLRYLLDHLEDEDDAEETRSRVPRSLRDCKYLRERGLADAGLRSCVSMGLLVVLLAEAIGNG